MSFVAEIKNKVRVIITVSGIYASIFLFLLSGNIQAQQWTWISGSNNGNQTAVYGTKGVAAASNVPGARNYAARDMGGDGNLWLFGGSGYDGSSSGTLNDLWKWDGTNWTWVSGSSVRNQGPTYGTKGVAASSNIPGSRMRAKTWIDSSGNLWLFGGSGYSENGYGSLNDLWKWDGTDWIWISGSSARDQGGTYGTQGVAAASNIPGARTGAAGWTDETGNFWLFGGSGRDGNSASGTLNDLWKWDGTNWTWVNGSSTRNNVGSYGTQGVAAASNVPGARYYATSGIDRDGNLWLFGGVNNSYESMNDLWKWDGTNWTWVSGSNSTDQRGNYAKKGIADASNMPGARNDATISSDGNGNFWLFGGNGMDGSGATGWLNDLWKWDGANWTWVSGSNGAERTGNYGSKGVPAFSNLPGARYSAVSSLDSDGNLWLFGGYGTDTNGASGRLNDLWIFDTEINNPGNNAPVASGVTVSGTLTLGNRLSGRYTYSDPDNDDESGSIYQWYRADDGEGTNQVVISGATDSIYVPAGNDAGKYLSFGVNPSDGSLSNGEVKSLFTGPVALPFPVGDGTSSNPYQISTLEQLQAVKEFLSSHFILMNDIDASPTSTWDDGNGGDPEGFIPIGNSTTTFTGSFDGAGHVISGLYIKRTGYIGLFGVVSGGALIKNIGVESVNITGDYYIGGLAGYMVAQTYFPVSVMPDPEGNNLKSAESYAGMSTTSSTITNSYTTGEVNGGSYAGGLVGYNEGSSIMKENHSSVEVTATDYIGGLVGSNYQGEISQSYATGEVTGGNNVAGLVGNNNGPITRSYATGKITGTGITGGFIGFNRGSISDSYATGEIVAFSYSGGFLGVNHGQISRIYAAGTVNSGGLYTGGLAGYNSSTITDSYWDTEATGKSTSAGGTGKTTAQMKSRSAFTGWDFTTVWALEEGSSYPFFQDQGAQQLVISGAEGWRLMSSPSEGLSLGTLLDTLWTQGFPGADVPGGAPNVMLWNEATRSWSAPASAAVVPAQGTSFLAYVYSDDDNDGSEDGFPKVLTNGSVQYTSDLSPDLSFTSSGNLANDGWNLLGNPYGSTINWDMIEESDKTNIDNSVYVWSDAASGGAGAYLSWNGVTGTMNNGKIAPWQGFWVKANASSPELSFRNTARSSGGVFRKQAPVSQVYFSLEGKGMSSDAIVLFHEEALLGHDRYDTYKLASYNPQYISLATGTREEDLLEIQALPVDRTGTTELALAMDGSDLTGDFELHWDVTGISDEWELHLKDVQTGNTIDLKQGKNYRFKLNGPAGKQQLKEAVNVPAVQPVLQKSAIESRFRLVISAGPVVGNEENEELPRTLGLSQNYPNPFNPSTIIRYDLPAGTQVELKVFDMLGREVAALVNEHKAAGYHQIQFEGEGLASGMYIYRLVAGNTVLIKKLTLIK